MGGAYLYCHVEALADVADLRLELICVCLVRGLLTPHEQESLFCMDTVLILHTPVNDWFVYAHDYALPGFRADARLHQRRHDRQEVRVDILHVTSVPILTSNS